MCFELVAGIWYRIHVGMDEMYETAQQAKYRFLGIDEMYKICDGWNVQNRPISCGVWIWILENLVVRVVCVCLIVWYVSKFLCHHS